MKMANVQLLFCCLAAFLTAQLASAKPLLFRREALLQHDPAAASTQHTAKSAMHGEDKPKGTPEGGIAKTMHDFSDQFEDIVKWPAESKLPKVLQWFLVFVWICLLASIPFAIPLIDRKPITRSQIAVGGGMFFVLFGGFFLFTNVILFQSPHFKQIRPLTMVECIYFMTQVITTVGYGDVTPAKVRGQVFVGLYVIGALFIIAMLISDLSHRMIVKTDEFKAQLYREMMGNEDHQGQTVRSLVTIEKPSITPLLGAILGFACIDLCWVLFFSMNPAEGKSVFQAIYMSLITLSSVGFGYFTPVTEEGMIFCSFFMLFGCAALVTTISRFTDLMVQYKEWEHFQLHNSTLDTLSLVAKGNSQMDKAEFLSFALLQMQHVTQHDLDVIEEAYVHLKPKQGCVEVKDIQDHLVAPVSPPSTPSIADVDASINARAA